MNISRDKLASRTIEIGILLFLLIGFFINSTEFFITKDNKFGVMNAIYLASTIFLFKGKYRIYALTFFATMIPCFTLQGSSMGSLFLWVVVLYSIVVILENVFSRKELPNIKNNNLLLFAVFALYMLIVQYRNSGKESLLNFFGTIFYLFIPAAFTLDQKAEKNNLIITLSLAWGLLAGNIFMASVIYGNHDLGPKFLEFYVPNAAKSLDYEKMSNFSFPGFFVDRNYNAFDITLVTGLLYAQFQGIKKWKINLSLLLPLIGLQLFGVLGFSKSYLIVFILTSILGILSMRVKKEIKFTVLAAVILLGVSVIIFDKSSFVLKAFYRLIDIDPRANKLLSSITTTRDSIWETYGNESLANPIKLLLGNGLYAEMLGAGTHNSYYSILWQFGLLGGFVFVLYLRNYLLPLKDRTIHSSYFLPFVSIIIFAMSLHFINDAFTYFGVFAIYSAISTKEATKKEGN